MNKPTAIKAARTAQDIREEFEPELERLNALFVAIWRMADHLRSVSNSYWSSQSGNIAALASIGWDMTDEALKRFEDFAEREKERQMSA